MWRYNTKTQRNRIFVLVTFVVMLFSSFASAESFPENDEILTLNLEHANKEQVIMYGYNVNPLNIRKEMSIDSKWIDQYPRASTIEILEELDGWYRVEKGFVKMDFVYYSIDIYRLGRLLDNVLVYAEPNKNSEIINLLSTDYEDIFIQKVNGFLELSSGGFVEEQFVTFSWMLEDEIKESTLTVEDMERWNMSELPIQYLGTLAKKTGGKGVTNKKTLNFRDVIPIYDIIDGYAYFPSGQDIYKISVDKFVEFKNVGPYYEILAAYRTVYYSSSNARKHNISLVSTYLDGKVIEPNATFSYNKTTGSRSASKGYQEAPVIESGQYVMGFGGGVCQVSSTIYAAIKNQSNFDVTERRKHGLEVSYIPVGMDATVSYGSIDLKFVNKYPFAVQLNVKSENGVCLVTITRATE